MTFLKFGEISCNFEKSASEMSKKGGEYSALMFPKLQANFLKLAAEKTNSLPMKIKYF